MGKPDTALVGAVCPSPNFEPRRGGVRPEHPAAALHGRGQRRQGHRLAVAAREQGLLPLRHRRGGRHHADGGRGDARLACGPGHVGRRERHQLGLHRHRDPEPRPRAGLPGLSRGAAAPRWRRCAGTSSPGTASGPSACSPTPTWRRRARRTRARSSPGRGWPRPASATGWRRSRCNRADPGIARDAAGPLVAEVQTHARRLRLRHRGDRRCAIAKTEFVVTAFQRHFRPERVDGRIDQSTITTLERLAAALPKARAVA